MPGSGISQRNLAVCRRGDVSPATSSRCNATRDIRGAALLEFAVVLPLLVVFVVGIFDFSGAFGQKQKIEQAAQEGAIIAGAQPMTDMVGGSAAVPTNPQSLLPVVTAIFNSLAGSGTLPAANQGSCQMTPPPVPTQPVGGLSWTYTISGCAGALPGSLVITINRGCVCGTCGPACPAGPPISVSTMVTVQYPYNWRFNSVIQLLFPGSSGYLATTQIIESSTVHNQQ